MAAPIRSLVGHKRYCMNYLALGGNIFERYLVPSHHGSWRSCSCSFTFLSSLVPSCFCQSVPVHEWPGLKAKRSSEISHRLSDRHLFFHYQKYLPLLKMATAQLPAGLTITCSTLFIPAASLLMGLRFYTRHTQKARIGVDDWLMVPAFVSFNVY